MKQNKKPIDIFGELGKIFEDAAKPYPQFLTEKTAAPSSNTGEGVGIAGGEWNISKHGNNESYGIYAGDSRNDLAIVKGENQDQAEANAKAICLSVNETIGKGYNPAAMGELVDTLELITSSPEWIKLYGGGEVDKKAKTALLKAKLNTVS